MSVCSSITRTRLEVPDKRKMLLLARQMQEVGCLEGFKHFTLFLRSSEELLVTVCNDNKDPTSTTASTTLDRVNFDPVMSDCEHPPSSPCRPSSPCSTANMEEYTTYLLGCYQTYRRPYVWVRSGHRRLVERCELYGTMNRDSPIDLHCMTRYCLDDISVWDVIGEVVLLTTEAPPANPFHVDHTYLDNLPLQQQALSSGSLLHSLNGVICTDTVWATDEVLKDIEHLAVRHVHSLPSLQ